MDKPLKNPPLAGFEVTVVVAVVVAVVVVVFKAVEKLLVENVADVGG